MDKFRDLSRRVADGVRSTHCVTVDTANTVVRRGKLALATKVLGRVDESVDPIFVQRRTANDAVERIQLEMHKNFTRMVGLFEDMSKEVALSQRLLADFRRVLRDNTSTSTHANDAAVVADLNATLHRESDRLIAQAAAAAETLRCSCAGILSTSLDQLRVDAGAAKSAVREAQVSLDLARSDLVGAEEQLAAVQETVAAFEAGGGNARALDGFSYDLEGAQRTVSRKAAAVENKKETYDQTLATSLGQLDYVLDQVSMATWSCYNVFFTALSNYMGDGAPASRDVSVAIRDLKNLQGSAKQLTRERRERLDREFAENERRITPPPTAAAMAASTGGADTSFFESLPEEQQQPPSQLSANTSMPQSPQVPLQPSSTSESKGPHATTTTLDDIFGS